MKKLLIAAGIGVIVVVLTIMAYAFRAKPTSQSSQTATAQPVSCGIPAANNISAIATIHIPDNQRIITQVSAGQTVRWINDSSETVTMRSLAVANDKECGGIGQPVLKPGDTWQLTFLRPGTWHFAVRGVGIGVVAVK